VTNASSDMPNEERVLHDVLDFVATEGEDYSLHIQPLPGTRVVRSESPSTRALRDLVGATFDMKRVTELCKEYLSALQNNASQNVQDALWMTAVVLYARCFKSGVRTELKMAALDSIPGNSHDAHNHFINLRDKFVAHSVNAYEQTLHYAVIRTDTSEVVSTGTAHLWANPLDKLGAETLERLAWAFYNDGMRRRTLLESVVDDEIRSLGRAEVEQLPDLTIETPGVAKANMRRKR